MLSVDDFDRLRKATQKLVSGMVTYSELRESYAQHMLIHEVCDEDLRADVDELLRMDEESIRLEEELIRTRAHIVYLEASKG